MTSTLPSPSAGQERDAFEAWWDAEEDPANWPKDAGWSSQKIHAYMAWQARAALTSASKQEGGEPFGWAKPDTGAFTTDRATAEQRGGYQPLYLHPTAAPQPPLAGAGEALRKEIDGLTTYAPHHSGSGMQRGGPYVRLDEVLDVLKAAKPVERKDGA